MIFIITPRTDFYPRPPRGGRHMQDFLSSLADLFLSTPSARRATNRSLHIILRIQISIHALREEGDRRRAGKRRLQTVFLSTPSARRATYFGFPIEIKFLFLSTPSARRATNSVRCFSQELLDFYPRPPRGGRPTFSQSAAHTARISIHALREEGDPIRNQLFSMKQFLSTPSARRATDRRRLCCGQADISIHALREEGDTQKSGGGSLPRRFLSTPSARRATLCSAG